MGQSVRGFYWPLSFGRGEMAAVESLILMPDWVLASLNRLNFPFLWGGKVDLVARDAVI